MKTQTNVPLYKGLVEYEKSPPDYLQLFAASKAHHLAEAFTRDMRKNLVEGDEYSIQLKQDALDALDALLKGAIARMGFALEFLLRLNPKVELKFALRGDDRVGNTFGSYVEERPWKDKIVAVFSPTILWGGGFLYQGTAWYSNTGYVPGF